MIQDLQTVLWEIVGRRSIRFTTFTHVVVTTPPSEDDSPQICMAGYGLHLVIINPNAILIPNRHITFFLSITTVEWYHLRRRPSATWAYHGCIQKDIAWLRYELCDQLHDYVEKLANKLESSVTTPSIKPKFISLLSSMKSYQKQYPLTQSSCFVFHLVNKQTIPYYNLSDKLNFDFNTWLSTPDSLPYFTKDTFFSRPERWGKTPIIFSRTTYFDK